MKIKKFIYGSAFLIGTALLGGCIYLNSLLPIITGYAAKNLCSDVFVSGRDQKDVEAVDLNFSFIKYAKNDVDTADRSVTSRFLWGKSEAIYRDGFGATLVRGTTEEALRQKKFPLSVERQYNQDTIPWPMGNILPDTAPYIDKQALEKIATKLITDNGYTGDAFAFMVLHKGIPVAEAYKPQYNKNTRFVSWSMAKSFTNALVGILVGEGKLDIHRQADIAEWKNDERSRITLNDLMQMQSGLKWNENYGSKSDVTLMLHCESNMSRYTFEKPIEFPAGTRWYYSSGTTNIVNYIIRQQFSCDSAYYSFAFNEFFNKTGMTDVIFETDPAGTFVGSSYLYATARDYARFGLLYLNDGVFNGERILPEGWVSYSRSEASDSKGAYGSFFWLNKDKGLPSAPEDMYMCVGHDGQRIFILPTQQLVVVVLGYSPTSKGGMDFNSLLKDILSTLHTKRDSPSNLQ
jgi:CubicO group peptidase (beta-lactamase class C family)